MTRRLLTVALAAAALAPPSVQARTNRWHVVAPYNAKLDRIAWCESGGRWALDTHNGYLGGLQFLQSTWRQIGGRGMAHEASELEQKFRAVLLIRRAGLSPWPVCRFA